MGRAIDAEIPAHAQTARRICITLDADFHALLVTGGERGPSVICIRKEGLDAAAIAALIAAIWPGIAASLEHGAMVTVTDRTVRIRLLPVASPP
jgi:predicted nuclease of predicted toxin-antitoxin system